MGSTRTFGATGRRVLITGVASPLATQLAVRLAGDPDVELVAGIDTRPPAAGLEGRILLLDADLRAPGLERVLRRAAPDVIVHHDVVQFPEPGRAARQLHDVNVVGTLQLLAACAALPTLRALVVRGSAAIYDSGPGRPAFHGEDEVTGGTRLGTRWQRDVREMERLAEAFARRHPDVACSVLRLQPLVGRAVDTPFMRLLRSPVVPTFLGFDPRIQVLDAEDAVDAVAAAVLRPVRGPVNVAGPGTISLSVALRRLRRLELPLLPSLYGTVVRRTPGLPRLTEDGVRFLRHGRAVDLTRMERELGFTPARTTPAAIDALTRTAVAA